MRVLFALLVGAALTADAVEVNPIRKVMNMLKDMTDKLESEAKADAEIYKKMSCWCQSVGAAKEQSIRDGNANIAMLETTIDDNNGRADTLAGQIDDLAENIKTIKAFLQTAEAQRTKENNAYKATKESMEDTIDKLQGALEKITGSRPADHPKLAEEAFLQVKEHLVAYSLIETGDKIHRATALVQAPTSGAEGYHKQGGVVTGILQDMLETFERNLIDANTKEGEALEAYQNISNIKTKQQNNDEKEKAKKEAEKGEAEETSAKASQDKDVAEDMLIADTKFSMSLKKKCEDTDAQMNQRETLRAQEMEGVTKAREILESDDVKDLMARSQKTPASFVQTQLTANDVRRQASAILKKAAAKSGNVVMSLMATRVRLDAFEKVHKAIDDMVDDLKTQNLEEKEHKHFCQKTLAKNESDLQDGKNFLENSSTTLERQNIALRETKEKKQTAEDEIAQANIDVKLASETRNQESEEYIAVFQNQSDVIMVLERVEEALAGAYGTAEEAGVAETNTKSEDNFVQVQQPPPGGFNAYEKQGSGGVLAMISRIKADAEKERAEAHTTEITNAREYMEFLADQNTSIRDRQTIIANAKAKISTLEKDIAESESNVDEANTTIEEEQNENQELHMACDFTLKNFNVSQTARANEIEALGKAKAIISGSGGVARF